MSALSDALNAANTEGLKYREIARRGGERVSHSQLSKYFKPSHPRPGEDVLEVFSDVLGIPLPKLRELAGLPAGDPEPYEPPREANRLDRRQRQVIDELIRMLADTKAGDGDEREAAPIGEHEPRLRAVADEGDPRDADEVDRLARQARKRQTEGSE